MLLRNLPEIKVSNLLHPNIVTLTYARCCHNKKSNYTMNSSSIPQIPVITDIIIDACVQFCTDIKDAMLFLADVFKRNQDRLDLMCDPKFDFVFNGTIAGLMNNRIHNKLAIFVRESIILRIVAHVE